MQVLVVARLPMIREGLRALISSEPDWTVRTLDPASGDALVERVLSEGPDVMLVDVEVLEQAGWQLIAELQQVAPRLGTMIVSDSASDRRVAQALAYGSRGYLLRDASADQLVAAIQAARSGLYVVHPAAMRALLEKANDREEDESFDEPWVARPPTASGELLEPLSERELEALRLLAKGLANKQIARELSISEHTVKFHIRSILAKLGAANRTEAVTLALQKGLVTL